jgi:hypothetical protein
MKEIRKQKKKRRKQNKNRKGPRGTPRPKSEKEPAAHLGNTEPLLPLSFSSTNDRWDPPVGSIPSTGSSLSPSWKRKPPAVSPAHFVHVNVIKSPAISTPISPLSSLSFPLLSDAARPRNCSSELRTPAGISGRIRPCQ